MEIGRLEDKLRAINAELQEKARKLLERDHNVQELNNKLAAMRDLEMKGVSCLCEIASSLIWLFVFE